MKEKDAETGRFRLNGEVHKLSEQYIKEIQLQNLDESKFEKLYQNIRSNISIEVLMYL